MIVTLCTVPSEEVGVRLAHAIVEAKLAACVNLVPKVRSIYAWQGEIHDEAEVLLVIKTTLERYRELETFVCANHPYEVPELIAIDVVTGNGPYVDWVVSQTRD